jgi:hypothetical protein
MAKTKPNKSQKVRDFIAANPNATAKYIATQVGVPVQLVYNVQYKLRNPTKYPKIVTLRGGRDEDLMKKLSDIPVYEDSVTNITSGRLEKLMSKRLMQGTGRPIAHPILDADLTDPVNRPAHYTDGGIETIDYIEAKGLGYHLGNAVKYISRAGKKGTNQGLEDLRKAQWYLARAIEKNEYASPDR